MASLNPGSVHFLFRQVRNHSRRLAHPPRVSGQKKGSTAHTSVLPAIFIEVALDEDNRERWMLRCKRSFRPGPDHAQFPHPDFTAAAAQCAKFSRKGEQENAFTPEKPVLFRHAAHHLRYALRAGGISIFLKIPQFVGTT
jgi:hypothetical protein